MKYTCNMANFKYETPFVENRKNIAPLLSGWNYIEFNSTAILLYKLYWKGVSYFGIFVSISAFVLAF